MYGSYSDYFSALQASETTVEATVKHYLQQIESSKDLNIFLEVYTESAIEQAKTVDAKLKKGTAGKLAGLVVGVKDVIAHHGKGLQAGSNILDGFHSEYSATAIECLLAEDAIIIGRQNCDEFAMGSTNENSAFGPTKNPVNPDHVPGGSSGASAAAIAAGLCMVSLGSDTGGSVRQPASFCGVTGLKPTYSRISRFGLIAYASSFDVIGILSKSTEDIALVLEVIAGNDDKDATVSQEAVPSYSKLLELEKTPLKIGYIRETMESEGIQEEVRENTLNRINQLKEAGHTVEAIDFPLLDYVLPTYYILTAAEASTNLSRFDGVRYGMRTKKPKDIDSMYRETRTEGFGAEVKRRIVLGSFVLSASYFDAYFTKAQKVRKLIQEKTIALLNEYDFLICPTSPNTAFKLGDFDESNPLQMYLADLYTVQASVSGIPAISVPNGFDNNGLPIGLQIMANTFEEGKLLAFSKYLENQKVLK